jgi:cytochrome c oxidase cbb3-type subunit 3
MVFKKIIDKKIIVTAFLLLINSSIFSQNAPAILSVSTDSYNMVEILLVVIAIILLFVIGGLGQVLVALSRQLSDKTREAQKGKVLSVLIILSLFSENLFSQTVVANESTKVLTNYGGISANSFYVLVSVIILEIFTLLFLFFSIKRIFAELIPENSLAVVKKSKLLDLWIKLDKKIFTKAIPLEQEVDSLLEHNYDGIRELDNALPPWWKYGFIITIGFAFVYLLNIPALGNDKNPTEEYAVEMANAKMAKELYESNNKDKIDEANVPMADADGIKTGKEHFSANCIACHGSKGEGGAGPNLTDNYWIHKGSLNDIYYTIKVGFSDKGMQSWAVKFNPKEMSEIASFVKTLQGTNPPGARAPQGDLFDIALPIDSLKTIQQDTLKVLKQ